jgi:predicted Zn finger-like uncharacterized protein
MKFACDKCNTRYSIADERVRGRVLKIRCKACNHVITVREEQLEPLNESQASDNEHTMVSTAPPAARDDAADEWFISFDGEQEGPLPLLRAIDRVRSERPSGKECYCWRNGFFVWLPVEDVPDFAPALAVIKPLPPPPMPAAVRSPSGSQAAARAPSGSQAAVRSPSGSQAAVRSPSGSQGAARTTGSQPAISKNTGPVGKITGSQAAARVTGSQPAARVTGSQPAIARSTGSHSAIGKTSPPMPAPAFDLPGFDSGPLGTPNVAIPAMPTKPESRHARRDEAQASASGSASPSAPAPADGAAPVSPFAAALRAAGPAHVSDAPSAEANAPRPELKLDTGPVPLPPPPGDDLPIGEASGLISLAHISKAALSKPAAAQKSIETFGGVPVMPSSRSTIPSAIVAAPGAAPSSAPAWMRWAALAGGVATIGLGIVVVLLVMRKPTVIVVPPAPSLDDKRMGDNPILLADPGYNPGQQGAQANDNEPGKHNPKQHARSAKPASKSGGDDKTLNGEQGKLAALYRDDNEHAVPSGARLNERGGAGGNVSQQAILGVVTQNRRSLNLCYDRVLKHDTSLKSGRVVTHVKIGISGSVVGVSVPDPQYANSEIGQCIAQTIKHWHFPAADSEYETEFPIILQAN